MTQPLSRIRLGAVVLAAIIVVAIVGYRIAGWSWIDAMYMVVITVSTVGYRELGPMTPGLKVFTMVVIVVGMSAAAYTLGAIVQMLAEGEIERALGLVRMTREIRRLKDHVIICGLGRMGRMLAQDLQQEKRPFVVVDRDAQRIAEATEGGWLAVHGDATEEDVLQDAGIQRARTVVTALPSDAANVFITLTSRNMNPTLQIISRGESPSTCKKLQQAGATRVVMPAAIGAQRIAAMIMRPSIVEFMELVAGRRGPLDVGIDELPISPGSSLVGKSVEETEFRRRYGVLVVAVRRPDGDVVFSPEPSFRFEPGDAAIVMGRLESLDQFRKTHLQAGSGAES